MKRPKIEDFEASLLRPMRNRSNPPLEYRKALERYCDWLEEDRLQMHHAWGATEQENEELIELLLKISKCKTERINPDEYRVTMPDNLMLFGIEALKQKHDDICRIL
jgi:hypothetical protein